VRDRGFTVGAWLHALTPSSSPRSCSGACSSWRSLCHFARPARAGGGRCAGRWSAPFTCRRARRSRRGSAAASTCRCGPASSSALPARAACASPGPCRVADRRSACAAVRWWRPTSGWAGSPCAPGLTWGAARVSARSARADACAWARAAPATAAATSIRSRCLPTNAPRPRASALRRARRVRCGGARRVRPRGRPRSRRCRPPPPRRRAGCRGPPTRPSRSWPARSPSAAWCAGAGGTGAAARLVRGRSAPSPGRRDAP
jgi:hypothetical protein